MREIEETLFLRHEVEADPDLAPTPIFILGAPRTGSTLLYQLMIARWRLGYFSNLVEDRFRETPIVGYAVQCGAGAEGQISFTSSYGRVAGPFQPSECNEVFREWFGNDEIGLHRMKRTVWTAAAMGRSPMVFKCAANCFRIDELVEVFPRAEFVWIVRDVAMAAKSDLLSRHLVKRNPLAWNARPLNFHELSELPYWEQVVECQRSYNRSINDGLSKVSANRWTKIGYEDLVEDAVNVLRSIGNNSRILRGEAFMATGRPSWQLDAELLTIPVPIERRGLPAADAAAIERYVERTS